MREIRKVKYKNIDFKKYDNCISKSQHPLIYANSWFLDIVTKENWDVLVYEDYSAVMPIPYARLKRYFWQKRIAPPPFCQQLGWFYSKNIPLDLLTEVEQGFINYLLDLKPYAYLLNATNKPENKSFRQRNNFVLSLNNSLDDIRKGYSTNLKRNIKKAEKAELQVNSSTNIDEFIDFFQKNNPVKLNSSHKKIAKNLIKHTIENDLGEIWTCQNSVGKDLCKVFFLHDYHRWIYLLSATNLDGKKFAAMPFMLNELIKSKQQTQEVLDFEGSEIEGIARFFRGFGAENKKYNTI